VPFQAPSIPVCLITTGTELAGQTSTLGAITSYVYRLVAGDGGERLWATDESSFEIVIKWSDELYTVTIVRDYTWAWEYRACWSGA